MIILVGKTCSGKSSVANILQNQYGFKRVVTYTTRPPRENEKDGVDYNFISAEKFDELKLKDFFFETTSYNVASGETWYYGTAKESLCDECCIVMNPDGLKKMKNLLDPDEFHIRVFYLNVSEGSQYNRLRKRGDQPDEATRRIEADKTDFADISSYYDYAISTDMFDMATLDTISPNNVADLINTMIQWENFRIS